PPRATPPVARRRSTPRQRTARRTGSCWRPRRSGPSRRALVAGRDGKARPRSDGRFSRNPAATSTEETAGGRVAGERHADAFASGVHLGLPRFYPDPPAARSDRPSLFTGG